MSVSRQVTGALAWAGLVIVVAVPAVELVRSKLVPARVEAVAVRTEPTVSPGAKAPAVAEAVPVTPTPVVTTAPPQQEAASVAVPAAVAPASQDAPVAASVAAQGAAVSADPVKQYLDEGHKLPDYITASASSKTPAAVAPQALPEALPEPAVPEIAAAPPAAAAAPANDETPLAAKVATAEPAVTAAPIVVAPTVPPVPMPASARPKVEAAPTVTEADLKDWKSGTLEDYLRQHGLLSGATPASADSN